MTREFLDYTRRAAVQPPAGLALGARSVVWGRFTRGEYEDQTERPWIKVIWCLAGQGAVRMGSRRYGLAAGQIAVFFPDMRHEAWAAGDGVRSVWEARWLTMDGPLCAAFAAAVGVTRAAVYPPVGDLAPLFDRCRDGLRQATPAGALAADLAAHELLSRVGAGTVRQPQDPAVAEALSLFRQNWTDPHFGVARAARQIGIHRSALSRRFRTEVGVPPQQHLIDLRLGRALMLLRSSDLSVREIAFQCGFNDPGYFTRHFRRTQAITPARYRATFQ